MGWNLRYSDRGRAKLLEDRDAPLPKKRPKRKQRRPPPLPDAEELDAKAARKRRRYARRMDETTEGLDAAGDAIREWLAKRGG